MNSELYDDIASAFALVNRPNKWIQYDFKRNEGQFCMVGAVREAIPGRKFQKRRNRVYKALVNALPLPNTCFERSLQSDNHYLVWFNDRTTTTYCQIEGTFRRAMKTARKA